MVLDKYNDEIKMKVLFVINDLGMGGAENMLVRLADNLAERGHTIKIVTFCHPVLVEPLNRNIQIVNYNTSNRKGLIQAFLRLRSTIKSFNPDIVHSHLFRANFLSRLVRISVPINKLICTEHSTAVGGIKQIVAYRITDSLADINTNVSAEAVENYIRKKAVKKGRMVSIPNGVDVEKFKFDPKVRLETRTNLSVNDKKVILAVGRLSIPKNYSNLLHSIALMKDFRKDFKLLIVGDGPLYEDLMQIRKELELEDVVEFLGIRSDICSLMQAADVYVMSSSWEGLPMVILEAMACQRVVVSTKCGGIEKLIKESGFTVGIKDPKALAKKIMLVLDMTENERLNRGIKARRYVIKNNAIEINSKSYLKLYYETVK